MTLAELLASLRDVAPGRAEVEAPPDWFQGRTLFGGVTVALAGTAARRADPGLGVLRSAQIAFIAPVHGTLAISTETLRSGRAVSFVNVDIATPDGLCARVILTYGLARESGVAHERHPAPTVPDPGDCPPVTLMPGTTPAFLEHLDLRLAAGPAPMSGGEPAFSWWVRHREAAGLDEETAALAIADVLPPAVLASLQEFRPASSVTWMVDLSPRLPAADGWYLLSTASDQASEGYSRQVMSCFSAGGELVSLGRQTVAIF